MEERLHDPVCGLPLESTEAAVQKTHKKETYHFCSKECAARFSKEPERYLGVPLIRLRNVTKAFGEGDAQTKVLLDINLNIWEGEFVSLVGASGSGKSTVLNLIGNLDRATSGTVEVRGQNVDDLSDEARAQLRMQTFGFVFQQYNLIPWLSALDNVLVPRIFAGAGRAASEAKMKERFQSVDLGHRLEHRPTQLSGGEQQRVALLRALANDPQVILGDEPTGNLDSGTGQKILEILKDFREREGKTLVVVTHDSSIAQTADRIIYLRDGRTIRNHEKARGAYAH